MKDAKKTKRQQSKSSKKIFSPIKDKLLDTAMSTITYDVTG